MHPTKRPFCPFALTDWIKAARQSGVPHIPARKVATVETIELFQWDTDGPHQQRLFNAFRGLERQLKPGEMARWDCCASLDLKHAMATRGAADATERGRLNIDDPRLLDILADWPRTRMPILVRPWIELAVQDGWPREYRVYVSDGKIDGISSYYPQRPLSRNHHELQEVRNGAEQLIGAVEPGFEWHKSRFDPRNPPMGSRDGTNPAAGRDPEGKHFTVDFGIAEGGGALLIEGGPPVFLGGHPCCFDSKNIEGIALEPRPGAETR